MRWRRIFPFDGWVLYSHEIKSKALTTLRLRSGQAPETEVHKGEPPGRASGATWAKLIQLAARRASASFWET